MNGKKVLIVDDNDISRYIVVLSLSKCGCTMKEAGDGWTAVQLAQKEMFDLIFMDIHMPVMCGLDAIKEIRKIDGYSSTPIIAVSASDPSQCWPLCREAGADDFIGLPANRAIYLEKVHLYANN